MIVPFCDLGREARALEPVVRAALDRVVQSGRYLFGDELAAFEQEIAEYHGVRHAVGVASGTDAVEIALRATGHPSQPEADGVEVTAFTAVPTINAIEAAGYAPILVDPDPVTRNAVTKDLHVHLYGLATDARESDVEDVAHAMGAEVGTEGVDHGMLAGTMGRCGALSFYPSKILGALGDGGCIITDEDQIAVRARKIRHYGFEEDGDISLRGQNSRLSEIQAAILRVKLRCVNEWIARRRQLAARYLDELRGKVHLPSEPEGHRSVYHVFVVEHPERDRLRAALAEWGIGTMIHYPRAIHQYARWARHGQPGQFPTAELLASTVLSLPLYPYLADVEQEAVIQAVKELT